MTSAKLIIPRRFNRLILCQDRIKFFKHWTYEELKDSACITDNRLGQSC